MERWAASLPPPPRSGRQLIPGGFQRLDAAERAIHLGPHRVDGRLGRDGIPGGERTLQRRSSGLLLVDIIYQLTGGGPIQATTTMSIYVYYEMFQQFNQGRAAAVAMVMFLMMLTMTLIYTALYDRAERAQS